MADISENIVFHCVSCTPTLKNVNPKSGESQYSVCLIGVLNGLSQISFYVVL